LYDIKEEKTKEYEFKYSKNNCYYVSNNLQKTAKSLKKTLKKLYKYIKRILNITFFLIKNGYEINAISQVFHHVKHT